MPTMNANAKNSERSDEEYSEVLRATVIYYSDKLDSLVQSMSEVQRQEYKKSVSTAFSLIEPYRNSIKKRDEAKRFDERNSGVVAKVFFYGFWFWVGCLVIDKLFFSGETVASIALALFGIGLVYALFVSFSLVEQRQAQVIHESFREKYLQQWEALGLDWSLLRKFVNLEDKKDSVEFDDRKSQDQALRREFERDKYKIPFELKECLALHISGQMFLIDFEGMDSDEYRSWDDLR